MLPDAGTSPNQPPEAETPYSTAGRWRPLLHGILLILFGVGLYFMTVVVAGFSRLIPGIEIRRLLNTTLWYSGLPVFAGCCLCALELLLLLPKSRRNPRVYFADPAGTRLTVVLTAYN